MSAPVEPFVVITSAQVIGAAVVLGAGAAGIVAAFVKWSFTRVIAGFDASLDGLRKEFKVMSDRQHTVEVATMSRVDCSVCRKECQDRILENQRTTIENDRIQNQKLDNLLLMVANVHNGMGGAKNGIHTEPKVYEKP
jgi:hypothetical protein